MLLTLLFSAISCSKPKPQLIAIGDAHVIQKLDNGNWEVTPAFVIKFAEMKWEIDVLKLQIEELREIIEELKGDSQ